MIVSLDGYIDGPNRELDWFEDHEFEQYCDEMIDSVGLALFGRRAYELMVSYWPNAEVHPRSPADLAFARKMNALPKLVLSHTILVRLSPQERAAVLTASDELKLGAPLATSTRLKGRRDRPARPSGPP